MIVSDHAHCSSTKCEKKEIVGAGGMQIREDEAENKLF